MPSNVRKRVVGEPEGTFQKRLDDKPTCTISIDFGTAGTGFAYSFAGSDVIESREPGGQEAKKTLTCLLLGNDGSFKCFGSQARRQYFDEGEGAGAFFHNYKMELNNAGAGAYATVTALNGEQRSLMDVITKTLRYVKDEALREAGRSQPFGLKSSEVQWVLTVPAIWVDVAKGFMRKAAYGAGLISEQDSRRLLLALEPESACIACDVTKLVSEGERFMVLDAGGGTVDVTLHRLRSASPLKFDEVAAPSGGPWGSTYVDSHFERFVEDLIGSRQNFRKYKESPFWIDQLEAWESIKTSFDPDEGATTRSLPMSNALEVIDAMKFNDLVDSYNSRHDIQIKLRGRSTIVLPNALVQSFFDPVVRKITSHVHDLLQQQGCKVIFLVGGFAESKVLQSAVKSSFQSSSCRVVVPVRPGVAVMSGAVLFGKNQDVFASRIARFSYGHNICSRHNPANPLHTSPRVETIMYRVDGKELMHVKDLFRRLVKVGDDLPAGHTAHSGKLEPVHNDQKAVTCAIYATSLGNVDFTTHQSCIKIGEVIVPVCWGQSMSLSLQFGATEITATAVNDNTGETVQANLSYEF